MVVGVDEEQLDGTGKEDDGGGGSAMVTPRSNDIPSSFLEPGSDFAHALAKGRFKDENQTNNILRLRSKLSRFHVTGGLATLTQKVIVLTAVNGQSRADALMAWTQIIAAEAMGVPLSNRGKKEVNDVKKYRERRLKNGADTEGEDDD